MSAPQFTYGRTIAKAMDVFDLDPARWPELAADRGAWRAMLRSGKAPEVWICLLVQLVQPHNAASARTSARRCGLYSSS